MRSVLRSSPPGAPRSIVSPRSIPRPTYMAAHNPAGPAPTMITSNWFLPYSVIGLPFSLGATELEPRRGGVARQGPRQLGPERHGVELDLGPLRPAELRQRRGPELHDAVAVAAPAVHQGRRGLDQALPHPGLVALLNNRTPDGFQRLVC